MADKPFKIFIIDDAASMRMYWRSQFEQNTDLEVYEFADGSACIEAVEEFQPELIIMDIEMPGKSGLELCKELRDHGYTHQILFFSANDSWDVRLQAYDVGGNDFIQKNAEQELLLIKVRLAQQTEQLKAEMQQRLSLTEGVATSAIASLGETGIVLQFLRASFACQTLKQLSEAVIEAIRQCDLNGIVALNSAEETVSRNMQQECTPLEVSILQRLEQLGRIYEAPDRLGINYPNARLLLSGIGDEDRDKVGRMRDHLALICEGADARVVSLQQQQEKDKQTRVIMNTAREMTELVADVTMTQCANHERLVKIIGDFQRNLETLFINMGLSESQEAQLHQLAHQLFEETSEIFRNESDVTERMNQIIKSQKKKLLVAAKQRKV